MDRTMALYPTLPVTGLVVFERADRNSSCAPIHAEAVRTKPSTLKLRLRASSDTLARISAALTRVLEVLREYQITSTVTLIPPAVDTRSPATAADSAIATAMAAATDAASGVLAKSYVSADDVKAVLAGRFNVSVKDMAGVVLRAFPILEKSACRQDGAMEGAITAEGEFIVLAAGAFLAANRVHLPDDFKKMPSKYAARRIPETENVNMDLL